jgi:hypothetical protein
MSLLHNTAEQMAIAGIAALNQADQRNLKTAVESNANAWANYSAGLERQIDVLRRQFAAERQELLERITALRDNNKEWQQYSGDLLDNLRDVERSLRRQSADAAGLQAMFEFLSNEIKSLGGNENLRALDPVERQRIFDDAWNRFARGPSIDHTIPRNLVVSENLCPYEPSMSKI